MKKKTAHSLKKCTFSKGTNLSKSRMGSQCPSRRCTLHCKTLSTDQKSPVYIFFFLQFLLKSCSAVLNRTIIAFVLWKWNRDSIRGQRAILYQRRALLCKYFSPQILQKKPHTLMSCRCTPTKSLVKRNKNSHSNNHSSIFCLIRQKESGLYSPSLPSF